jgi:hypothetical protein
MKPTRSSPFGCVVALFGVMSLILSGFFWRGFFLAERIADADRAERLQETMSIWGGTTAVIGVVILILSWKMVRATDMSDPGNTNRPKVRF